MYDACKFFPFPRSELAEVWPAKHMLSHACKATFPRVLQAAASQRQHFVHMQEQPRAHAYLHSLSRQRTWELLHLDCLPHEPVLRLVEAEGTVNDERPWNHRQLQRHDCVLVRNLWKDQSSVGVSRWIAQLFSPVLSWGSNCIHLLQGLQPSAISHSQRADSAP